MEKRDTGREEGWRFCGHNHLRLWTVLPWHGENPYLLLLFCCFDPLLRSSASLLCSLLLTPCPCSLLAFIVYLLLPPL